MEPFAVTVAVAHPTEPESSARVDLLVDTGATISFVPSGVLANLGIQPRGPEREF